MSEANNDGDSDGADFLAWQRQLGSVPAVVTSEPVPQPVTLTLALLAGGGLALRCSQRR